LMIQNKGWGQIRLMLGSSDRMKTTDQGHIFELICYFWNWCCM
jgi:hypothetical protein